MNLLPLRVPLFPSRRLAVLLVAMHGLAGVAAWLALPLLWMRLAAAVVFAASLAYALLQPGRPPIAGLEIAQNGAFELQCGGAWEPVQLIDAFVTPQLAVLRFKLASGKPAALTLLPDSLGADDFRRLRVILRWANYTRPDIPARGGG